ncbi:MAG: UbiD family decarboxylase [Granulosicoccaceae bacterium]
MSTINGCDDLRGFIAFLQENAKREYLQINDSLKGDWQLAAINQTLVNKMRMPVIEYTSVQNTNMSVVQNVCASLSRIAKSKGWTVAELEERLAQAYDNLIAPQVKITGPIRENVLQGTDIDLGKLPAIRYTDTETNPYISAAHVVARDPVSGSLNISFHRLMICGKNKLALYATPAGHFDRIHQHNMANGNDTPIAAFIGAHPLWSLGALAAGGLELDEMEVIGGLCGSALPVVRGLHDEQLLIPANAEIVLEGSLSHKELTPEGPYGEAFGYVSEVEDRPVFTVQSISHRHDPLFQDIVPSQLEHLTMTGVAVQVYLQKLLLSQFSCIERVFLPTAMTVYIAVNNGIRNASAHDIMSTILREQRFVKHVVLFDDSIDISNAKQTQIAISMQVQAHRDVLTLPDQPGNELDPSEINGRTTKWGVDASSYAKYSEAPLKNKLPAGLEETLDTKAIIDRALGKR